MGCCLCSGYTCYSRNCKYDVEKKSVSPVNTVTPAILWLLDETGFGVGRAELFWSIHVLMPDRSLRKFSHIFMANIL